MAHPLKLFVNIFLIASIFCATPTAQAVTINAAALNKALSAPVQNLWPQAVAYAGVTTLIPGIIGLFTVPTIEEFGIGCCVGGFNAAITCGLLKLAKNGPLWTKACAALACPVFLSVGASYKSKSCMDFAGGFILFGVVPSAAGIMAANYVQ